MLRDQEILPDPIFGVSGDWFKDPADPLGINWRTVETCRIIATKGMFKLAYIEPEVMRLPSGFKISQVISDFDIPLMSKITIDPIARPGAFKALTSVYDFVFAPCFKKFVPGWRDLFDGDCESFGSAILYFYSCPVPYSKDAFLEVFNRLHRV